MLQAASLYLCSIGNLKRVPVRSFQLWNFSIVIRTMLRACWLLINLSVPEYPAIAVRMVNLMSPCLMIWGVCVSPWLVAFHPSAFTKFVSPFKSHPAISYWTWNLWDSNLAVSCGYSYGLKLRMGGPVSKIYTLNLEWRELEWPVIIPKNDNPKLRMTGHHTKNTKNTIPNVVQWKNM